MANDRSMVSAFAFGLLSHDRAKVGRILGENGIESRPLVCGSIGRQPFWIKRFGHTPMRNADRVHFDGLYIPCNQAMTTADVEHIAALIPRDLLLSANDTRYWQESYPIGRPHRASQTPATSAAPADDLRRVA